MAGAINCKRLSRRRSNCRSAIRTRTGLHGRGLHRNSSRVRRLRRTRIQLRGGVDRRLRTQSDNWRGGPKIVVRLLEKRTPSAKFSRLSLGVESLLRRLQQLSLEIVSDDSRWLASHRLANTAARLVGAALSNGADRLTRRTLDGGQRSEGVSVHVE
jgi:hypothetical protein